jgi:hypothetical protein
MKTQAPPHLISGSPRTNKTVFFSFLKELIPAVISIKGQTARRLAITPGEFPRTMKETVP